VTSSDLIPYNPQKLDKVNQRLAIQRGQQYQADYVGHITLEDVRRILKTLGERDQLLVKLIYDGCLRVSEALSIRPDDFVQTPDGWQVRVLGKGKKRSAVAVSASLVAQLQAYAYRNKIPPDNLIFPISRKRVWQIVSAAMSKAGVVKPDGVGTVHVLRHSGALERLKRTGNPKAVQDQLRHSSVAMTLRYMKTLTHEESLKIQQKVDMEW
jgi:integrase